MIIFGWKGVTLTGDKGAFHCPQCGAGTAYKERRVRRFFTLYFLPVIPLDLLSSYIECQLCQGTYRHEVLKYDPAAEAAAFRAVYHDAILRVMVRMLAADGRIEPAEVRTVQDLYHRLTGTTLEPATVETEAASLMGSTGTVRDDLTGVAGNLNDHGRERVLQAAFLVASADGAISDEEVAVINELGAVLGMTPAHVRGVYQDMLAPAE